MRITRTIMLAMSVAMLVPAEGQAQTVPPRTNESLAGLIPWLFDQSTINEPFAGVQHPPHFIVGENVKLTTRDFSVSLASQLSSFPLASSSGGFTFSVNDRGEVAPTSTNFGPSFAERGVTIGRRKFNLGFTYQTTRYNSFEGVDLDSGGLKFIREHNDCCPAAGPNNPAATTDFGPAPTFERDLLRSELTAEIETWTTAFFANYGVTDRFDLGLAVPFVDVQLDATVNSTILRLGSGTATPIHSFNSTGASTVTLSESASATGLGDVLVRAKYNFFRNDTAAMAAAVDLRLPTGDKDNLLGTGATQTKLFFISSGEYGRFSPHVNFGYTFSNGETSEEATRFDLDATRYRLDTLPAGTLSSGFVPEDVDLSVPDEVNYTVGFSLAASSRVTLGFDLHGRQLRDVARLGLQNSIYPRRPDDTQSYTEQDEFSLEDRDGNLNLMLGVVGGKINLGRTFLLNLTVLFPMSDDGLKPKPTPVIGFDYVF